MLGKSSHAATIEAAIARDDAARHSLVASWQRSATLHDLSPEKQNAPDRLTQQELSETQERLGLLMTTGQASLDQLYLAVGDIGCSVVLADKNGIVVARRGAQQDDRTLNKWGLWTGAVWSEQSEGTNGVGTCIIEERPLTIHKDQHFHTKNTGLSCTAAPIFDHDGDLIAVIDVSSSRADLTAGLARLISVAVIDTARRIETDHFSANFSGARIILATPDTNSNQPPETLRGAALIAVDRDDLVIGATRCARNIYGLSNADMKSPKPLSSLRGHKIDHARQYATAERRAVQQTLASTGGNISAAAKSMGISRATLHRKMNKFGIGK